MMMMLLLNFVGRAAAQSNQYSRAVVSEPLLQLLSGAKMFSFDAENLTGIALVLDLMFAAHVTFLGENRILFGGVVILQNLQYFNNTRLPPKSWKREMKRKTKIFIYLFIYFEETKSKNKKKMKMKTNYHAQLICNFTLSV